MKTASTSGSRILRVLKALKGHTITGISNGELAVELQESPPNISRALKILITEGLAVKLENGRFAHSIQVLQIAQAHAEHITRIQGRISEINQRITTGSFH